MFDKLYEEMEQAQVHFLGYASEQARYDFAIVYTDHFFGKPIVICMQTGRSSLISDDDLINIENLQKVFNIEGDEHAEELSIFLRERLPGLPNKEQY